jgi:hypothetical protein
MLALTASIAAGIVMMNEILSKGRLVIKFFIGEITNYY